MKYILATLLSFITSISFAAGVRVTFLNGIDGEIGKSIKSRDKIKAILVSSGYISKFESVGAKFTYFLNPGDGFVDDKVELFYQATLSSIALSKARNQYGSGIQLGSAEYKYWLGALYRSDIASGLAETEDSRHVHTVVGAVARWVSDYVIRQGNKQIIVSHSQGNFFAEAVDAYIRYGLSDADKALLDKNLRFVGVASVAASTPNNRYISISEDKALDAHVLSTSIIPGFSALPRNANLCVPIDALPLEWPACVAGYATLALDPSLHGFLEIYTSRFTDLASGSSLSAILAKHISDSFDEIVKFGCDGVDGVLPSCRTIKITSASCVIKDLGYAKIAKWTVKGKAAADGALSLFTVVDNYYSTPLDGENNSLTCSDWTVTTNPAGGAHTVCERHVGDPTVTAFTSIRSASYVGEYANYVWVSFLQYNQTNNIAPLLPYGNAFVYTSLGSCPGSYVYD